MGLEEMVRDRMDVEGHEEEILRRERIKWKEDGGWDPTLIWIYAMCGPALAILHVSPMLLPAKQKSVSPILWIRRLRLNEIKEFVQGQPVREARQEEREAAHRG